MDKRYFSEKVVEWYLQHKRELPWRETNDPYRIWLSEVILQQTRVKQGLPYYLSFIEKYPEVTALAKAKEQDILRLWQGLGYYTRARNLHKCARVVSDQFKGQFPNTFESLRKLPGIGDYTAAAIASFSFKEPVAVLDGNVFRVLARVFGIEKTINSPDGKKHFFALANSLINHRHPDIYNQAVMEFGALHCTPKQPACESCVFKASCSAHLANLQEVLPAKNKLKAARKRYFYYFVIQSGKSLLMKKRDQKDIWHGLFDFPLIERKRSAKIEKLVSETPLQAALNSNFELIKASRQYKHILSHQIILSTFILLKASKVHLKSPVGPKFYTFKQVDKLPKPILINRFLNDYRLL